MPAVVGIMNDTVAEVRPVAGAVRVPFKKDQSTGASSGAPTGYIATQSVGLPGPLTIVTVTRLPPLTFVGETVRTGAFVCTVNGPAVPSRVYVLSRNKRI